MRNFVDRQGVTLIELVVVVAVMSIISLLAAPQITSFKYNINASQAARQIVSDMQLARSRAIFESMDFKLAFHVPSANQYKIMNSPAGASSWTDVMTQNLPDGIEFGAEGLSEGPGGEAIVADGVTFNGDEVVFRNTGTTNKIGTVYIIPTRDKSKRTDRIKAVKLQYSQTAKIKGYRYDGDAWTDF